MAKAKSLFGVQPIVPYLNRDYKTLAAMQVDWDKGLDFYTASGQACNKKEIKAAYPQFSQITCRYNKKTQTGVLKL